MSDRDVQPVPNNQSPLTIIPWQSILDGLPVPFALIDPHSNTTIWTSLALQQLLRDGTGTNDVQGLSPGDYLPTLDPHIWEEAVRNGGRGRLQFVHHATRNIAYWEWALNILSKTSDSDDHSPALLIVSDITETIMNERQLATAVRSAHQSRRDADTARKEAEDALAAVRSTQNQMVQMEKMRAVGELAQGIAHDINNALMAVLGYADLAIDELEDLIDSEKLENRKDIDSPYIETNLTLSNPNQFNQSQNKPEALLNHLSMIHKAATDASSTVQRLNKFARRGISTHGDITEINDVVTDVVQMTRPRWRDEAQRAGKQYSVHTILEPLPTILGEPSGLREVLINMIHNALNAMPDGGTLTLATRLTGDHRVEIEVQDTGVGMPPEILHRIFDPFFTTRGVEGTGLGLAVSWSIIQRHGGSIDVESEPGVGTHFFIRLPINRTEQTGITDSPAQNLPMVVSGFPLLVVEDDAIVRGVLSSMLTRHGYRVTTARNAEEALEKIRSEATHFDLVVTDHGMPGMNGLQLIAEIRRSHPHLPTLLLTGWGASLLDTNIVETMPNAILGKPINQNDLLLTIERVRGRQESDSP